MSWDVMVLDAAVTRMPVAQWLEEWKNGWRPPPLGSWAQIRDKITACLPEFQWPPSGHIGLAHYDENGLSLEIYEPSEDPVLHFDINVRRGGGGDPLPTLARLARTHGWALLDKSTGEYLNLEHPSDEGWQGFNQFCDRPLDDE